MPQGMEIFKADGTLRLALTDRLMRVTGSVNLAGTSGSVTVDTTLGTPWGVIIRDGTSAPYTPPSISGGTISWTASDQGVLLYGVY